mmetsp:Transcript_29664/g.64591  ORF Transcript_29664/g.64591 Transcript_29664/m.64591 type:complete len:229 (-) Transcript_29664:4450-5136(-)
MAVHHHLRRWCLLPWALEQLQNLVFLKGPDDLRRLVKATAHRCRISHAHHGLLRRLQVGCPLVARDSDPASDAVAESATAYAGNLGFGVLGRPLEHFEEFPRLKPPQHLGGADVHAASDRNAPGALAELLQCSGEASLAHAVRSKLLEHKVHLLRSEAMSWKLLHELCELLLANAACPASDLLELRIETLAGLPRGRPEGHTSLLRGFPRELDVGSACRLRGLTALAL